MIILLIFIYKLYFTIVNNYNLFIHQRTVGKFAKKLSILFPTALDNFSGCSTENKLVYGSKVTFLEQEKKRRLREVCLFACRCETFYECLFVQLVSYLYMDKIEYQYDFQISNLSRSFQSPHSSCWFKIERVVHGYVT